MVVSRWIYDCLLKHRLRLFPWAPVFFAAGIAGYFALQVEPSMPVLWAVSICAVFGVGLAVVADPPYRSILWAVTLVGIGFALAALRAQAVAAPQLGFRYYGPIEGRVVHIDRSGSDAQRLTLDQVVLFRVAPDKTPARVRVSLHNNGAGILPSVGDTIVTTGHLSALSGPAEPYGFDFRRHAWFIGIGAVGYTRNPVLRLDIRQDGFVIARLRTALSDQIYQHLKGQTGAVAMALTTGDRSEISAQTVEALRRSNLAHLLAISGLHMGLVVGVIFGGVRLGLASVPRIGLRVPSKQVAALVAIMVAAGYLALSGRSIATERAFVMAGVVLLAVLLNKQALTLRAISVAALVVLTLRPESLLSPGFQMSFAATTALIAVFGALRGDVWNRVGIWRGPVSVVISSAIAGAATAPFAAAHFNTIAQFGLIANLASVPVMGFVVMPCAVIGLMMVPFGLEALAFVPMGWGIDWILGVADWVAHKPASVRYVPMPSPAVIPLVAIGGLWAVLTLNTWRLLGAIPILTALCLWHNNDRPAVLVSERADLVALYNGEVIALSKPKGAGFVAKIWIENAGFGIDQVQAHGHWPTDQTVNGRVLHVLRKKADVASARCDAGDILISAHPVQNDMPCRVIDPMTTAKTGSIGIWIEKGALKIISARDVTGRRVWSQK